MFDLAQEIRASNGNPRQFAELPHGGANRGFATFPMAALG